MAVFPPSHRPWCEAILEFELLQGCAGDVMKFKINPAVLVVTDGTLHNRHMKPGRQSTLRTRNMLYGFLTQRCSLSVLYWRLWFTGSHGPLVSKFQVVSILLANVYKPRYGGCEPAPVHPPASRASDAAHNVLSERLADGILATDVDQFVNSGNGSVGP